LEVALKLSRFCNIARRSKVVDHARLSYALSSGTLFAIAVSHQQRIFLTCGSIAADLPMLFITQYKLRAFRLSAVTVSLHYLPRCLRSTVTCGEAPTS